MGFSLNSGLLLYAAGSLMGTISYLLIIAFQQLLGSSLGKLFFTLDYDQMITNACYSGLWGLIFMFLPYQLYRNILIGLLPGLTFLAEYRGGFNTVLNTVNLNMFTNYETPLILICFCVVWGLGIPKILKQGGM